MKQTSQLGAHAHNFPRGRAAELPKETLLKMYRDMVEQRRFEEATGRAYGLGKIMGFHRATLGEGGRVEIKHHGPGFQGGGKIKIKFLAT
jgi:TPP-dependent pyruvate/acetoin dehydrogenase alpha subunit